MKPVTNILLALALICYAFLPFYDISMQGSITGIAFTAGHISHATGPGHVLGALLPFIAGFAAIGFNCLKNRHWAIASIVAIVAGIMFLVYTGNPHEIALQHDPAVTPFDGLGEGFEITGLGWGNRLSFGLHLAALLSAIVSLMPFTFNERIERAVDEGIDRSIERIDRGIEQSRRHIRAIEDTWKRRHPHSTPTTPEQAPTHLDTPTQTPTEAPTQNPTEPSEPNPEDHTRFMPH